MATETPNPETHDIHAPVDAPVIGTAENAPIEQSNLAPDARPPAGPLATSPATDGIPLPMIGGLSAALIATVILALVPEDSTLAAGVFSFVGGAAAFYTAVALAFLAFDDGDDSYGARIIRAHDGHSFRPLLATAFAATTLGAGLVAALELGPDANGGLWLVGGVFSMVLLSVLALSGRR